MAVPVVAGISATATAVPVAQETFATGRGGSASPAEPHRSQRRPAEAALPSVESMPASDEAMLTVQMPLSLPLRTSWARMDRGAHNAAATASNASPGARGSHRGGVGGDAGW